jgi:prenylcysteine oxidase/farnesylcysteine lyase
MMGLWESTQRSFPAHAEGLDEETSQEGADAHSRLMWELGAGVTRVNYNQDFRKLNGMAGSIAMYPLLGGGGSGSLFAVKGGNVQIVTGLLERAAASVVTAAAVSRIELSAAATASTPARYQVTATVAGGEAVTKEYDYVVMAAPLETADIDFGTLLDGVHIPPRSYQDVHATFVQGVRDPAFFGLSSLGDLPDAIYTTESSSSPFASFATYSPARYDTPYPEGQGPGTDQSVGPHDDSRETLGKYFSRKPLTDETLANLYTSVSQVRRVSWKAYPQFSPPEAFAPFVLHPPPADPPLSGGGAGGGLYYINSFENAGSCLETTAVAAKNTALLLVADHRLAARDGAGSKGAHPFSRRSSVDDTGSGFLKEDL